MFWSYHFVNQCTLLERINYGQIFCRSNSRLHRWMWTCFCTSVESCTGSCEFSESLLFRDPSDLNHSFEYSYVGRDWEGFIWAACLMMGWGTPRVVRLSATINFVLLLRVAFCLLYVLISIAFETDNITPQLELVQRKWLSWLKSNWVQPEKCNSMSYKSSIGLM